MTKIYIVTSGDYSDYTINAVFTTKTIAEEYKDNFHCDDVEEYDLNPSTVAFEMTYISMTRNGNVKTIHRTTFDKKGDGFNGFFYSGQPKHEQKISWYVNTKDKEQAIKVVNEKRIQILANDCWGDDERTKELFNQ